MAWLNAACADVPLRERPARAALQVLLETDALFFGRKLQHDHQRPRPVPNGVPAGAVVVPFQASGGVARAADGVAFMVGVAAEDVDEALAGSFHARMARNTRAVGGR
jgi:hypothetical protein